MKTVAQLKLDFNEARKGLQHIAKLRAFERVYAGLEAIERAACVDPNFPLIEIREAQSLIAEVGTALSLARHNARKHAWQ